MRPTIEFSEVQTVSVSARDKAQCVAYLDGVPIAIIEQAPDGIWQVMATPLRVATGNTLEAAKDALIEHEAIG